jgi:hypothetical protein
VPALSCSRPCARAGLGLALLVLLVGLARPAAADGLESQSARAIGRAGAALVGDDGGTALLASPGGLVRRDVWRVQLGVGLHDRDLDYRAPSPDGNLPAIEDHGPPTVAPELAFQGPVGRVVVGAAYLEPSAMTRALPEPLPTTSFPEVAADFPHRYAGTGLSYRERTLVAGAAIRASDWLGLGASVGVTHMSLTERRHVWAGMAGRDDLDDPRLDLAVTARGSGLGLAASAGALLAPPSLPLELAASVRIAGGTRVRGPAAASQVGAVIDRPDFPAVTLLSPRAVATLPSVLVARAGVRWLGERVLVEIGGDVTAPLNTAGAWRITGVEVTDETGAMAEIPSMPVLLDRKTHGAVRAAADVEVIPGFLWLSAGYAYRTRATPLRRTTPAFADLGGHTVAAGIEVFGSGMVLSVGYAHTEPTSRTVTSGDVRSIDLFDAGTEAVGLGTYRSAHDAFGAALEISWE